MENQNIEIVKDSQVPIYIQLKILLTKLLKTKGYRPGDPFFSEGEIAKKFQISRMTVRRVMDDFVNEGILVRIPGKGTFISKPKIMEKLTNLIGFTEDMIAKGYVPSSKILRKKIINPSNKIRNVLQLNKNEKVILLERIRFSNGEPVAIQTSYIPHRFFKEILSFDMEKESLYNVFKKLGKPPVWGRQDMEAVVINKQQSDLLRVKEGSPGLISERTTFDLDDIPIEFTIAVYRGDSCRFTVNLTNPEFVGKYAFI